MARVEIKKPMFVDGQAVHVSGRAPFTDALHLSGGKMTAPGDKLGRRMHGPLNRVYADQNLVLKSKLEFV